MASYRCYILNSGGHITFAGQFVHDPAGAKIARRATGEPPPLPGAP